MTHRRKRPPLTAKRRQRPATSTIACDHDKRKTNKKGEQTQGQQSAGRCDSDRCINVGRCNGGCGVRIGRCDSACGISAGGCNYDCRVCACEGNRTESEEYGNRDAISISRS